MKTLTIAVVGCGARGQTYSQIASELPNQQFQIVAGADPVAARVEKMCAISGHSDFQGFDSADALLAQEKLADILIISTPDNYHYEPCKKALELGYDILLEKPIADDLESIIELETLANKLRRKVMVCFVLRYTPFYRKVKEIIDSGQLGDIVSVNANEGVVPWHQGHSFVRGHWSVTENSTPMIVQKCCHDTDILPWLIGEKCLKLASYGSLKYFKAENAPAGSPERCTDGCPHENDCLYNAKLYATEHRRWLAMVFDRAKEATNDEIYEWLKTSPWGRCIFKCDNTAVDHQVIAMEFADDVTATFTMTAFENQRHIEIYGTKGILRGGHFYKTHLNNDIIVTSHDGFIEMFNTEKENLKGYAGHGGGDEGIVHALYEIMASENPDPRHLISQAVHSHIIAYAAEKSRVEGCAVDIDKMP
ncbi:MAG: Gfo/Idh/MocA family oxidoreductase [Phycisphaerae bacterium]|nr:Gfo/Idh/MocA family oxidoreductase [Phycisphaerae bacterium]